MALKDGKLCCPLGDLEELDGGDCCIAGRVSVGDRSELGMVNLRSIGEIAADSGSPFLCELLDGEWLALDPYLVRLGELALADGEDSRSSVFTWTTSFDSGKLVCVRILGRAGRECSFFDAS